MSTVLLTRRTLIVTGVPALALGACSPSKQSSVAAPGIIHEYHAPRPVADAEHAVVYRREDEFCAWTYTRGFWEDGNGRTWPQYFVYRCPGCYSEFQFNVLTSTYE